MRALGSPFLQHLDIGYISSPHTTLYSLHSYACSAGVFAMPLRCSTFVPLQRFALTDAYTVEQVL